MAITRAIKTVLSQHGMVEHDQVLHVQAHWEPLSMERLPHTLELSLMSKAQVPGSSLPAGS